MLTATQTNQRKYADEAFIALLFILMCSFGSNLEAFGINMEVLQ